MDSFLIRNLGIHKILKNNKKCGSDEHAHFMVNLLGLNHSSQMQIIEIDEHHYENYLSDKKFNELNFKDKFLIKLCIFRMKIINLF